MMHSFRACPYCACTEWTPVHTHDERDAQGELSQAVRMRCDLCGSLSPVVYYCIHDEREESPVEHEWAALELLEKRPIEELLLNDVKAVQHELTALQAAIPFSSLVVIATYIEHKPFLPRAVYEAGERLNAFINRRQELGL